MASLATNSPPIIIKITSSSFYGRFKAQAIPRRKIAVGLLFYFIFFRFNNRIKNKFSQVSFLFHSETSHKSFDREMSLRSTITQSSWCPHAICSTNGDVTCAGDVTINNVTINNITTCNSVDANGSLNNMSSFPINAIKNACACDISKNMTNYHKRVSKSKSDSVTTSYHDNNISNTPGKNDSLNYRHGDVLSNSISNIYNELGKNNISVKEHIDEDNDSCPHKSNISRSNNAEKIRGEKMFNNACHIARNGNDTSCPNCPFNSFVINNSTKHFKSDLLCCHRDVMKSNDCVTNCCCHVKNPGCCHNVERFSKANALRRGASFHEIDSTENCVNEISLADLSPNINKRTRKLTKRTSKLESLKNRQWSRDSNTTINIINENWKTQSPGLRR